MNNTIKLNVTRINNKKCYCCELKSKRGTWAECDIDKIESIKKCLKNFRGDFVIHVQKYDRLEKLK